MGAHGAVTACATGEGEQMLDVNVDESHHVAVLTLNRPQARNAVDGGLAAAIEHAVDEIEANPAVWVTVVTGAPPVFCAGADLVTLREGRGAELSTPRGGFAGFVRRARTKPVIAAVEGAALAGGMEIVLACDLVVAAENARLGLPEVKRSLVAAAGGMFRLGRHVPRTVALEMIMTGDPIGATRAYELGLVNSVCPPGAALSAALELAGRIVANAPEAVRLARAVALECTTGPDEHGWAQSDEAMAAAVATRDFQEGITAFLEKRAPNWVGA